MIEYKQYIEGVLSGKIVASRYIKQAAQRIEDFKKRPDMYFDEAEVERCFNFMSYFKEWSGAAAGKSGALLPFQKFVVGSVIGLKWKKDDTRVCRDLFMLISRKNSKSSLIAKLSLYMLLIDGEANPFIGCVATSTQQARILFEQAQNYLKTIDPDGRAVKPYRNYLKCPSNNGEFHVFSSDSSNMDGYNFSMAIEDETHAYKDNKMDAVLRSSMGARKQPMVARITTAGFLLDGYPCFETYKVAIEVLAGIKTDDTFFPFLYVLDPEDIDTWDTNEENWIKCNPGIDVVCSRQYLRDQVQLAHNDSTQVVNVKTKHFNIFCQSASVWLRQEDLAACMKEKFDLEQFRGSTAYIGVDLSSVSDTTSLAVMIPHDDKFYFKGWIWLPRTTFNKSVNHTLYQEFVNSGDLIITEGNVVDYQVITNKILELGKFLNIEGVYYDLWNSTNWSIQCTELGLPLKPFRQGLQSFNNPTKELEKLVLNRKAVISKSLMAIWMFNNCSLRVDHNDNCLDINTDIPTTEGFKKMKDIEIGDYVFNAEGKPTKVVSTTEINYGRKCYKVKFKNGEELVCDGNHEWLVEVITTHRDKKNGIVCDRFWEYQKRSTEWIFNRYKKPYNNIVHTKMCEPVQYSRKDFIIEPYVLGLWLGDGISQCASFAVNKSDMEMYEPVSKIYNAPHVLEDDGNCVVLSYTGRTLYRQLSKLNLIKNKHIPEEYFYGDIQQRIDLVQGLLDTDGTCNKMNGQISFSQVRKELVEGLAILLDSLGIRHSKVSEFDINGKKYYRLNFYTNIPMFKLKRKLDIQMSFNKEIEKNTILSVEEVESVPVKCLTVEDESHLFLAGRKYTVSGNCKPEKSGDSKKIDIVIAMLEALGGYLQNPALADCSIYVL